MGNDSWQKFWNHFKFSKNRKNDSSSKSTDKVFTKQEIKASVVNKKDLETVTQKKIDPWFIHNKHLRGQLAIALFDFSSSETGSLNCKKGDLLLITSDRSNYWLEATNQKTHKMGFIPSSYITEEQGVHEFMDAWHDINRSECDRKLLMPDLSNGTFILRPSSDPRNLVLSVLNIDKQKKSIKHFKIEQDNSFTAKFYIARPNLFLSIAELIQFYQGNHLLSKPWPCENPPIVPFRNCVVNTSLLKLTKKLGKCEFGKTYACEMNSINYVAKKVSSSYAHKIVCSVSKELHQLSNPHLVRLLCVCDDAPTKSIFFVYEYVPKGKLIDFLRNNENIELPFMQRIKIIFQVAQGMDYLEDANIVHGDLRAAHVYMDKDLSIKISNFGLQAIFNSTDLSKKIKNHPKLRWAAPEVLRKPKTCTIQSDVWSFAVLMFEILTSGREPYAGIKTEDLLTMLEGGHRVHKPNINVLDVYVIKLMEDCFNLCVSERPTFRDLRFSLQDYILDHQSIYDRLD